MTLFKFDELPNSSVKKFFHIFFETLSSLGIILLLASALFIAFDYRDNPLEFIHVETFEPDTSVFVGGVEYSASYVNSFSPPPYLDFMPFWYFLLAIVGVWFLFGMFWYVDDVRDWWFS